MVFKSHEVNMNSLFIRTLLLVVLAAMLITACGTSAPPSTEPASTQASTLIPSVNVPNAAVTTAPEATPTATAASTAGISFSRDILPIFESRCINCHGGRKTEKGLDLKTYNTLMAGSEEGIVLIPGDSEKSSLAQLLVEGKMPKRGPKLTPSQLQMVLDWINSGAENN